MIIMSRVLILSIFTLFRYNEALANDKLLINLLIIPRLHKFACVSLLAFIQFFSPSALCGVNPQTSNSSVATQCAEDDNVNIPVIGNPRNFTLLATHPTYSVATDNCQANFSNCPTNTGTSSYKTPLPTGNFKIFDDGDIVIWAVREAQWWLASGGMSISADDGIAVTDINYIQIYKKIANASQWPQVFVLYADGNVRLKPQPPSGVFDVCFGSSVIVGPAAVASRPFAEIGTVHYSSTFRNLLLTYRSGGTAYVNLNAIDQTKTQLGVVINYPTSLPFATFRSMYVSNGNADVDYVKWLDSLSANHNDSIMAFLGGESNIGWSFYRKTKSIHNTSAPDIALRLDIAKKDDLVIDFNNNGIWIYLSDGSNPKKLHPLNASQIITTDLDGNGVSDLVIDFKLYGIWGLMNYRNWVKIHDLSSTQQITAAYLDDNNLQDLVIDFAPFGVWKWMNNQTWVQLHSLATSHIVAANLDDNNLQDLVIDFTPYGVWKWMNNQTWVQLHSIPTSQIVAANLDDNNLQDLVIDFAPFGVWKWMNNQTWVQLHSLATSHIVAANLDDNNLQDLVIDFTPYGVWKWMNNQTWVQLHSLPTTHIVAANLDDNNLQDLIVDFAPYGLWKLMNNQSWTQLDSRPIRNISVFPK